MKIGDVIGGKYTLVRLLGEGGMGEVFEAVHARIPSKRSAIKILRPELLSDSQAVARFEREADAASAIGHEGIVDVYDLGVGQDGAPYMVMEYLVGRSLEAVLAPRRGAPIELGLTVHVAEQVLSALVAAHAAGVIHRDLKPDNIFLVDRGADLPRVKLLDFGIARIKERGPSKSMTLTSTGTIIGTPYYMSPEQAFGSKDQIDHRTDLWSLGVILYICVTGAFPFDGENYNQVLGRIITDFEPPTPRELNADVSPELERVVLRAMCKDLGRRYGSAQEMLADVRRLATAGATGEPLPERDEPVPLSPTLEITSGGGDGAAVAPAPAVPFAAASAPGEAQVAQRRSRGAKVVAVLAALVVLAIGGAAVLYAVTRPRTDEPPTASTPTEPRPASTQGAVAPVHGSAPPTPTPVIAAPPPTAVMSSPIDAGTPPAVAAPPAVATPATPPIVATPAEAPRPRLRDRGGVRISVPGAQTAPSALPPSTSYGAKVPRAPTPPRQTYQGTKL